MKSYLPGTWYAVFGDEVTVVLPPSEKARVGAVWSLVDDGAGFDAVLDQLLSGGLSTLAGFGLVGEAEGTVRALFRGNARATFETGQGPVRVDGTGAATWAEVTLTDVSAMLLEVDAEAHGEDDLPIDAGLVRVARISDPARSPATPVVSVVSVAMSDEPVEQLVEVPVEAFDVAEEPVEEPVEELVEEPAPAPYAPPLEAHRDPLGESTLDPLEPIDASPFAPPLDPEDPPTEAFAQQAAPSTAVARLLLSTGASYEVDRAILFGRAPEARRFQVGEEPLLVAVDSPHQEISSTHLEIRPATGAEHGAHPGAAVVTDLGSTNGTVIIQPGLGPEELQAGIAVPLIPGAIVDLGDGVTIQVTAP